jgi:hypothetical protein
MRTFLKDELERFLMAIDQALGQPVEVIVIGGGGCPSLRRHPRNP